MNKIKSRQIKRIRNETGRALNQASDERIRNSISIITGREMRRLGAASFLTGSPMEDVRIKNELS